MVLEKKLLEFLRERVALLTQTKENLLGIGKNFIAGQIDGGIQELEFLYNLVSGGFFKEEKKLVKEKEPEEEVEEKEVKEETELEEEFEEEPEEESREKPVKKKKKSSKWKEIEEKLTEKGKEATESGVQVDF